MSPLHHQPSTWWHSPCPGHTHTHTPPTAGQEPGPPFPPPPPPTVRRARLHQGGSRQERGGSGWRPGRGRHKRGSVWSPAPKSPPGGPVGPGADREAVFLLAGKQAPCVCLRTDAASDEEPGASKSARGHHMELTAGWPWPGQPFLGGCPGSSAAGRGPQSGQEAEGAYALAWAATLPARTARWAHCHPGPQTPCQGLLWASVQLCTTPVSQDAVRDSAEALEAHRCWDRTNSCSPWRPLQPLPEETPSALLPQPRVSRTEPEAHGLPRPHPPSTPSPPAAPRPHWAQACGQHVTPLAPRLPCRRPHPFGAQAAPAHTAGKWGLGLAPKGQEAPIQTWINGPPREGERPKLYLHLLGPTPPSVGIRCFWVNTRHFKRWGLRDPSSEPTLPQPSRSEGPLDSRVQAD